MKATSTNAACWPPLGPAVKPPLGLKPTKLHRQERMESIIQAMSRFTKADKQIPVGWIEELKTINDRIYKHNQACCNSAPYYRNSLYSELTRPDSFKLKGPSFYSSEVVDAIMTKVDTWQQGRLKKPTLVYLGTALYNSLFPNWRTEVNCVRYLLGLRVLRSLKSPKYIQIV